MLRPEHPAGAACIFPSSSFYFSLSLSRSGTRFLSHPSSVCSRVSLLPSFHLYLSLSPIFVPLSLFLLFRYALIPPIKCLSNKSQSLSRALRRTCEALRSSTLTVTMLSPFRRCVISLVPSFPFRSSSLSLLPRRYIALHTSRTRFSRERRTDASRCSVLYATTSREKRRRRSNARHVAVLVAVLLANYKERTVQRKVARRVLDNSPGRRKSRCEVLRAR